MEGNGRLALSLCCGAFMPQNNLKCALPITRLHRPAGPLPLSAAVLIPSEALCKCAATRPDAVLLVAQRCLEVMEEKKPDQE